MIDKNLPQHHVLHAEGFCGEPFESCENRDELDVKLSEDQDKESATRNQGLEEKRLGAVSYSALRDLGFVSRGIDI